jgi:hypothetical protein
MSKERPSSRILLATAINRDWVNIKENIRISAKESQGLYKLKQLKLWCDECLGFVDQRKQANMWWLQDLNQSNVDDLNKVQCEASRHLRNKKKEYLKAKIDELEINSKMKNIRDLYRDINIVKDEKGDLVTDSHSILARWRNHFS